MSDAYDRLIESRLATIESRQEADRLRIAKLELWQRTILAFVAGIGFASGALSREFVAALQALPGS